MRARDLADFAVSALVDEDGRPVAEVASPAFRSTPTELVACPYHDARGTGPMNRSALAQMTGVWPSLLGAFAQLAGPSPTVHAAWRAAVTAIALPLVAPQPVPRVLSGLFKTSLGLSQVFTAMLLAEEGVADAPLDALGDGHAFYRSLDQGRWLVGATQVCAGSPAMIAQAFDALCGRAAGVCPPIVSTLAAEVDVAPRVVGLHAAHLLGLQACARRGGRAPGRRHPAVAARAVRGAEPPRRARPQAVSRGRDPARGRRAPRLRRPRDPGGPVRAFAHRPRLLTRRPGTGAGRVLARRPGIERNFGAHRRRSPAIASWPGGRELRFRGAFCRWVNEALPRCVS